MRTRYPIALLMIAALALGACSSPPAPPPSAAAAGPVKGGTLVAAIDSDPGQLNPAITTSGGTHTASELIFNGLVGLTPELKPVPELAQSWEVLEGGKLYRFRLR